MKSRDTEFFIARRLAAGSGTDNRNAMLRIASLTVAVSVAVMIISVAVIRGFRREISDRMAGFGAHVQLVNLAGNNSMETPPIHRDPALEEDVARVRNFGGIHAYSTKGGIITGDEAMQGIMLKGVDPGYDTAFFHRSLVGGTLPRVGTEPRNKDMLISRKLADVMRLGVGDQAQVLFVKEGEQPRRDRFRVCGIYDTGFEEMDRIMVLTDMRNVQRLCGWTEDRISGYEVATTDPGRLERFADDIYGIAVEHGRGEADRLMVVSMHQRFMNLFDWLTAHNINGAVIITIMMFVAFFNMVGALLIILLERTSMIGLLKALGMRNAAVRRIFVIRSSFIIASGLVWGNIAGAGICLVQKYTHLVKLDQSGYFLSEVPVSLGWWILWLDIAAFALLTLMQTIPTMMVSRIKPDRSMRYQ